MSLKFPGEKKGTRILVLFGSAFTALGITALLAVLGVIWLGIIGSYKEIIIGVVSGELCIERLAFGRRRVRVRAGERFR